MTLDQRDAFQKQFEKWVKKWDYVTVLRFEQLLKRLTTGCDKCRSKHEAGERNVWCQDCNWFAKFITEDIFLTDDFAGPCPIPETTSPQTLEVARG